MVVYGDTCPIFQMGMDCSFDHSLHDYICMKLKQTIILLSIMTVSVTACGQSYEYVEFPDVQPNETLIYHTGYTVSYDTKALIPKWIAYELTAEEVAGEFPRSGSFGMDPDFHGRQAMREDYSYSGWDKGHMAPAADMKWSSQTMYESFYLTNICPQNHTLNERDWQTLEKWVREWAQTFGRIYVICGPIIGSNKYGTIGDNEVVVPDAFFKAILAPYETTYISAAFVMPNEPEHHNMRDYTLSVNELEAMLGMDFFPILDDKDEEKIESFVDFKKWDF